MIRDALILFQKISKEMDDMLSRLRKYCYVGVVSGSDLAKVSEQLSVGDDDDSKIFRQNYILL